MGHDMTALTPVSSRPRKLGARIKHFWLAQRMAKRTGVDLSSAYKAGELSQESWSKFVTRCQGCSWARGCQSFLDQPGIALQPVPVRCENSATLNRLKSVQRS
ncbi:MAG: DUF6455 family protein [Planktotalea sp.]|uniref:DUF6455 family protein n=1 Tax=Planktotalea sp. TaxID=2029877 RepID=UPI003C71A218